MTTVVSPSIIFFMFSTVSKPAFSCASLVDAPICGVDIKFRSEKVSMFFGGSSE